MIYKRCAGCIRVRTTPTNNYFRYVTFSTTLLRWVHKFEQTMSKANQFDLSKLSQEEKKALDEFMEELFTMAILAQDKKS